MRATSTKSMPVLGAPDLTFQAALGVVQNTKNLDLLAVHNEGQKIVAFERSKMSNPKIYIVVIDNDGPQPVLRIAVGTDPRTRKALLDGKANEKSANRFIEAVQGAVSGAEPAPVTPVPNHYLQKKTQVPWTDPNQEPDIDLGFSWLGLVGYMH